MRLYKALQDFEVSASGAYGIFVVWCVIYTIVSAILRLIELLMGA